VTAEKLQDAIGLLPVDLIAEADKLRSGRPKVIPWKRYAAMAACFVLVACAAWFASVALIPRGATETAQKYEADMAPAAAAPMAPAAEEAAPEESPENGVSVGGGTAMDAAAAEAATAYSVETPLKPGTVSFSGATQVTLVTSRKELDTYLADKDWIYDFAEVREVCAAFDEAWFEEKDLLLLTVHAAYADVPYAVSSIENTGGTDLMGWDWYVFYTTAGEDHPEGKTTCFHLLTELEKGKICPEERILAIADPIS